jgi:hypothetical protein
MIRIAGKQLSSEKFRSLLGVSLKKHIPSFQENPQITLSQIDISNPVSKFRILSDLREATGRDFTNLELNNISTAEDILRILHTERFDVVKERKTPLKDRLTQLKAEGKIPENMHWVPTKRILTSLVLKEKRRLEFEQTRKQKALTEGDDVRQMKAKDLVAKMADTLDSGFEQESA